MIDFWILKSKRISAISVSSSFDKDDDKLLNINNSKFDINIFECEEKLNLSESLDSLWSLYSRSSKYSIEEYKFLNIYNKESLLM